MKNVLIVGCGNMGAFYDFHEMNLAHPRSHLTAFLGHPEFKIVGLVDSDLHKLQQIRDKTGIQNIFTSLEQVPRDLRIDVATVATSTSARVDIIRDLATRCSFIFCEKPVALNLTEARLIQQIVHDKKTSVLINYSRRWNQKLREVFARLQSGEFGEIQKINTIYSKGFINNGSHQIDLLHMLGCQVQATRATSKPLNDSFFEPTFCFELQLIGPQGEEVTSTHTATNYHHYTTFELDLLLTEGRIKLNNSTDHIEIYKPYSDEKYIDYKFLRKTEDYSNTQNALLSHAVEQTLQCLKTNTPPHCTLQDGMNSLIVGESLRLSLQTPQQWHTVNYDSQT